MCRDQDDLGEHCNPVGVEQTVQGSPDPIIPEVPYPLSRQPDRPRSKIYRGFMLTVDRLGMIGEPERVRKLIEEIREP